MEENVRENQTTTQPDSLDWVRYFNKRMTNRLTMRFAGRHIYAVIHHQGRKSGKEYLTPVVAMPSGRAFIFPLPYSEHTDWCRNVIAAGGCQMEWRGRLFTLKSPQLLKPELALHAFPGWMQYLLKNTKMFLKMEQSEPQPSTSQTIRKILVYGAGVLGSMYAGKLQQAGYDVTLLARGKRLEELRERGLLLVEDETNLQETIPIRVTDQLAPQDAYDLVLVVTRKNQLPSVLPPLAANQSTPNLLFLVNNAEGPAKLVHTLGRERVILGFPGAGGQRVDGVVRYRLAGEIQPTTIGELDGQKSERLIHIAEIFRDAGLPVAISENMDAWLKTHVALVSPIANALYLAGGSNYRLARTRDGLVLMVRAVKEGLRVLNALHIPITPGKYRVFSWIPEPLLVAILQKRMGRPEVELVAARHANAARDEMTALAEDFQILARQSGLDTPAIDTLYCFLDPINPPLPEGQARIKIAWGPTIAGAGALISIGIFAGWLLRKKSK